MGTSIFPIFQDILAPLSDERLFITLYTDGTMNLDSLQSIVPGGAGSGSTNFQLVGTTLSLPSLHTVERLWFDLDGGASLDAATLATYSCVGLPHGTEFFSVDDSTLSLPSLTTLDAQYSMSGAAYQYMVARNGGHIDLPDLTGHPRAPE